MTEVKTLTDEQVERALTQAVRAAGPNGLNEDDLRQTLEALEDLAIQAALWKLWEEQRTELGWNGEELIWRAA